ncbi:DUF6461 domain-containing protein [Actinomadura sp. 9N407]|uniref:DUF6461 domain-containing protein n=1 Tax=Actinomadura sp. 9N407 TaxID=3375154 RepID=UPI0037B425EE
MEVPNTLLAELAGPIAGAMPLAIARVPKAPAAELGRLRAMADGTWPIRGGRRHPVAHSRSGRTGDSPVRDALGSLLPLLTERLLGALELTVPELDLADVPDLSSLLGEPLTGNVGFISVDGTSEAVSGVGMLNQIRPGAVPLVAALARRLATHPRVAALLAVGPEFIEEQDVAAAHGAAHLALAVATSAGVLRRVGVHPWATEPPAVLGVAIGTAVLLLRDAPMPPAYDAALLAKTRAEYVLPRHTSGSALVWGHRFGLMEGHEVPEADFSGNGLVAVASGGAVIRTGVETGHVQIVLTVLDGPPPDVATGWEEIVEVSWRANAGGASVVGPQAGEPQLRGDTPPWAGESHLRRVAPPWPGDYRLRVHARGRDDPAAPERYELVVWQAPVAPEIVHARMDRLGHRLRGEPEPARPALPEATYRWVRDSALSVAATVTVVTGADVADVLRAFGADPARPESLRAISEDVMQRRSIDPWVAVLDVGGAVLAVEYNGFQGSSASVLTRASTDGRAASMYWNVNALTRLSFAEHGEILLSEEPYGGLEAPPQIAETLTGLDFADHHRRKSMMGLVAVQRFTGHGITAEDLARIEAADIAFRIVPDLPTLHPHRPQPDNPLGPAADVLTGLPEPTLRDLAWWIAAEAARYAGIAEDPDIAASLTARTLTPDAHLRARRSQLSDGEHRWLWLALHRATNPDPLAAVTDTLDAARYAAGPHAANLIADAQSRITRPNPP